MHTREQMFFKVKKKNTNKNITTYKKIPLLPLPLRSIHFIHICDVFIITVISNIITVNIINNIFFSLRLL